MYNNRAKKCKIIIFRVTENEREIIEDFAYKRNQSISSFILTEINKAISANDSFNEKEI